MGDGRWDASQWTRYASDVAAKPREAIFRGNGMSPDLDPRYVDLRESVDSASNPQAPPVMVIVGVMVMVMLMVMVMVMVLMMMMIMMIDI